VKRHQTDLAFDPSVSGWTDTSRSATQRRTRGRRLGAFLLLIPLMVGLLGVPASPGAPGIVRGDELADAKAKQAQLKKEIDAQKAQVAQLAALQNDLADGIKQTADQLRGINTDLAAVKVKISNMAAKIDVIKADYNSLVAELKTLKDKFPDVTGFVLTAADDVEYVSVISMMEIFKTQVPKMAVLLGGL